MLNSLYLLYNIFALFSLEGTIFDIIKYTFIGLGVIVFIFLFFKTAGYGRYNHKGWGLQIDNKLGWVIMEAVSPIVFLILYLTGNRLQNIVGIIFLLIWEIHYVQRAFVYPFLIRGKKKIPIIIIIMGMIFNTVNSYLQGRYLYWLSPEYNTNWLISPQFIIGVCVFIAGYVVNLNSDYILRHLRDPEEHGKYCYKIPYGGLFKYITSPNYFGEILEWIGWAILTWSLTGAVFAIWTAANLIPRAISHHKWYHEKFEDYPVERKAIIPFIV
ncbi:MAG: DUF1295 domain-containing protein [Promethearchaeota archaeon]